MKKHLLTVFVLLFALCAFVPVAGARTAASVDLTVKIDGGGTAEIITEEDRAEACPPVTLGDGAVGRFKIEYTAPGEYRYIIRVKQAVGVRTPAGYRVCVTVTRDENDVLTATVIMNAEGSDQKADSALFLRPETPPDDRPPHQPNTGDENRLSLYLLLAIAASAGLFALAAVYLRETNRLIKKHTR